MTKPPTTATSAVTTYTVVNESSAQVWLPQAPTAIAMEATTLIPASTTTNRRRLWLLCDTRRPYACQRPPKQGHSAHPFRRDSATAGPGRAGEMPAAGVQNVDVSARP